MNTITAPDRRRKTKPLIVAEVLSVFLVAVIVSLFLGYQFSMRSITMRVTDKERVCSTSDCRYMIFTDQGEFEDSDSIFRLKFRSADLYNQLQVGHSYNAKVIGWRIPLNSTFPNLLAIRSL